MSFPSFATGEVLTAADMNAVGLWLVKTQTVGTAVATQNVTSCFSSQYDNYMVTLSGITATSNGGTINYRLLSGTTPAATNYTGNTFFVVSGAAGGLANAPFNNLTAGELISITTASRNSGIVFFQAPFLSEYTRSQHQSTDNNYLRFNGMTHTLANSYDGIQLITSAGTITGGTVRVYGMRN